jgi:hypothetical protein
VAIGGFALVYSSSEVIDRIKQDNLAALPASLAGPNRVC